MEGGPGYAPLTSAQCDRIIALLEEMIEEQRLLRQILTEPPPEITIEPPCTHPLDARTDQNPTATFWKCKTCGHVYDNERET